jgi:hypothetical protein
MIALFIILMGVFAAGLLGGGIYWGVTAYQRGVKELAEKMSDAELVELAMQNGGEVTLPLLIQNGLTASEAKRMMWQLQFNGLVVQRYDWTTWQNKYVLQGKLQTPYSKSAQVKARPAQDQVAQGPRKLTDAEVIQLAMRAGGKLTPASLCVKAQVPVDEAKAKLDELYRKEIFTVDVNEMGTITYLLTDQDLLA